MLYNAFKHAPFYQHALVPFGFRRRVSWRLKNTSLVLPVCDRNISKRLTAHTETCGFPSIRLSKSHYVYLFSVGHT